MLRKSESRENIVNIHLDYHDGDLFFKVYNSKDSLLSTPTHEPCWIDPSILITRLRTYQQSGKQPGEMDLQIALSRCILHSPEVALKKAKDDLHGEYRALIQFLLEENSVPQKPFTQKGAWVSASLTRKEKKWWPEFFDFWNNNPAIDNYTGQLSWETTLEHLTYQDYRTKQMVTHSRKILEVKRIIPEVEKPREQHFFTKWIPGKKILPPNLYEALYFNARNLGAEHNDTKRIFSLVPNNYEGIFADLISKYMRYPDYAEATGTKLLISAIQFMYDTWRYPGEMSMLFLATAMLTADKTISNIAAELWIKAVSEQTISNVHLGEIIGKQEATEFAPLKRFTDMVTRQLMRISKLHDKQLQILIESILRQLPIEPIKHLRKLLEIYAEVVALNQITVTDTAILERLKEWQTKKVNNFKSNGKSH